jgi:hypothetical protein
MTLDEFLAEIQKKADKAGSQKQLAIELGLKPSELSDCLTKRRKPPKRLLDRVGFEMVPDYQPRRKATGNSFVRKSAG